jgi:hypothetical protein
MLKEDEPFHRMNFNHRGHQPKVEVIPKYSGPVPTVGGGGKNFKI